MARNRTANLVGKILGETVNVTTVNVTTVILTTGQDVFEQANNAYGQANLAYGQANNAYGQANLAYNAANNAQVTVFQNSSSPITTQKINFVNTSTITVSVLNDNGNANVGFTAVGGAAYDQANNAYGQANLAYTQANNAFDAANNRLSLTGGTVTGNVVIVGNLTVQGNATTINVSNLAVNDSIILLATNQVGDSNDIGFVGHFDRGANATHAGLIRKATQNQFYLFDNYEVEPTNNVIDVSGNNFRVGNLRLGIINADTFVTTTGLNVTNQANNAFAQANLAYTQANNAYTQANNAYTQANNARVTVFANNGAANATTQIVNFVNTSSILVTVSNTAGNANIGFTATDVNANTRVLKAGDTMTGQLNISSGGLLVTGSVGIANTNPQRTLVVGGTIESTTGGFRFPDGTTQTTASSGDASTLNGISAVNLFNNMGAAHTTRSSFDASTPSYGFGYRFVQGSTNGPGTGGTQYYSWYIGLGSDYPATGAGSYGAMFAVDRNVATPYMSVRYNEGNSFSSWRKVAAGYADSAGTLSNNSTISGLNFAGVFALTGSGASTGNSTGIRFSENYGVVWDCSNSATWHHQVINGSMLCGFTAGGTNWGSGRVVASNDVRGTIFYDYNDTGFYIDPANGGFNVRSGSSNRVTTTTNDSGVRVTNAEGNGVGDVRLGAAWGRPGIYSSSYMSIGSSSSFTEFVFDNIQRAYVTNGGSFFAAAFFYTSDNRLKTDIKKIDNALEKVTKLEGVSFKWIESQKNDHGLIAQNVEEVVPEAVYEDQKGYKNINPSSLLGFLVESIKELKTALDNSNDKIKELEYQINNVTSNK